MLLANIAVAEKIVRHFPACSLLRRHPTPAPSQFEPILRATAAVGLSLDVSTSKVGSEPLGFLGIFLRPGGQAALGLVFLLMTRERMEARCLHVQRRLAEYRKCGYEQVRWYAFETVLRASATVGGVLKYLPLPSLTASPRTGLQQSSQRARI